MGRTIRRVPLDFAWPQGKRWVGYTARVLCPECRACGDVRACKNCYGEMVIRTQDDPPEGEGWQLWETTSEGSPSSPVFATSEELCQWCAKHASLFARFRHSVEDWRRFVAGDFYQMDLETGALRWAASYQELRDGR